NIPKKDLTSFLPEFAESFFTFMQKESLHYDILHCHYYLSGLIGILINEKINKELPLITTFHTLALMKNLVARNIEETETQERIAAEMLLVKESNRIVSPSTADAYYLEYLYHCPKEKISVIAPGVNTDIFKPLDKYFAKK